MAHANAATALRKAKRASTSAPERLSPKTGWGPVSRAPSDHVAIGSALAERRSRERAVGRDRPRRGRHAQDGVGGGAVPVRDPPEDARAGGVRARRSHERAARD